MPGHDTAWRRTASAITEQGRTNRLLSPEAASDQTLNPGFSSVLVILLTIEKR